MNDTARPARRPHEHIHVLHLSAIHRQFSRGRESLHGYIHLLLSSTAFDVDVACRSPTLSVIMASSAGQRHVVIAKLSPVIVREWPDWSLSWSPWMCPPRFINDMTHTRLTAARSNTVECCTDELCVCLRMVGVAFACLTRMWADAQRDGRHAEYRWRPLLNPAKFG